MKPLPECQLTTAVEQEVTHHGASGLGLVHGMMYTGVLEKLTRK